MSPASGAAQPGWFPSLCGCLLTHDSQFAVASVVYSDTDSEEDSEEEDVYSFNYVDLANGDIVRKVCDDDDDDSMIR